MKFIEIDYDTYWCGNFSPSGRWGTQDQSLASTRKAERNTIMNNDGWHEDFGDEPGCEERGEEEEDWEEDWAEAFDLGGEG